MPLKGQAKINYQRNYMRLYRLKRRVVRPSALDPVRPYRYSEASPGVAYIDADGNMVYEWRYVQ